MNIVCAWCHKDMGEKDGEGIDGVSHGVCEECLNRLLERTRRTRTVRIARRPEITNRGGGDHWLILIPKKFKQNLNIPFMAS